MTDKQADALKLKLQKLAGVVEVAVLPNERTLILKIDKSHDWDDAQVYQLLRG